MRPSLFSWSDALAPLAVWSVSAAAIAGPSVAAAATAAAAAAASAAFSHLLVKCDLELSSYLW